MSSTEEFKRVIGEINAIKPPGVSGSRIKLLKDLFVGNPDAEEALTQTLIDACKSTAAPNKLGVLYVLDAIMRALIDQQRGQTLVGKIEPIIPALINDSVLVANDDIKDKIGKLVDIWDQCNTLDKALLTRIKNNNFKSHTPPGSPPAKVAKVTKTETAPSAVLSALANLAAKKSPTPTAPSMSSSATTESNPNAIFQLLQTMNKGSPASASAHTAAAAAPAAPGGHAQHDMRERNDRSDRNDRGRRDRDRSPQRNQPKSTHIDGEQNVPSNPHFRPKRPYVDREIPQGSIGVLSRTIFVGGVPSSMGETELAATLRPYAEVQSVILNSERKHAFVKVYSRAEAEQVIQALSNNHASGLRARWGVGFGPRDCCNYQTGISTIPIHRLTDADRKWLMCAQWGGSLPDLPIQSGLFVEEPDIEVGSGVSSKSISRKMPTNTNPNGPRSDRNATTGAYQPPVHQQMPPQQMPQQQFYQQPGFPQQPMQGAYYGQPGAPAPQMPPMPMGGMPPNMNQAQMMAMMSQMMAQNQNGANGANGANGMDMAQMFQTMANMMQQQSQSQPPR